MNNGEYDDIDETGESNELDNEYDTSGLFNQSSSAENESFGESTPMESSDVSSQSPIPHHDNSVLRNSARQSQQRKRKGQPRRLSNPSDPQNHQRPDMGAKPHENNDGEPSQKPSTNKDDKGARRLRNSNANRGRNSFLQRMKNRFSNSDSNESNNNSSNDDSSSTENSNSDTSDELENAIKARMKRLKMKIIIWGAVIGLVVLLIMAFFMMIFGIDASQTVPAISAGAYDANKFESAYEKNSEEYKNEIEYYKKLQSAKKEYAKDHDDELKTNYIHSVLIYLYYQVDVSELNGKEGDYSVNYKKMTDMVDKIVELMKTDENSKTINYDKNGDFYNHLKGSNLFKDYYELLLKDKDADTILDGIFDLAADLDEIDYADDTVISSETEVSTPQKTKISINQYITDSVYASTDSVSNSELVKAYTIVYSTNIVADNKKLSISSSNVTADNALCDVKEGCSYDSNGNLVSGGGSRSDKNTVYYNGKYYYKKPLSSSEQSSLNKSINSTFGYVLVNSDGTYPKLDISTLGGLGDGEGDYKTILSKAYGDNYKYKNVGENSYILDGSYGDKKVQTTVIFYDQKDYSSSKFCGIKGYTIGGSGCGVTAMAIVASTYENNKKYDPIYMNNEATKKGLCGGGNTGTKQAFFSQEAKAMGYKYVGGGKYDKSFLNLILKHLAQGHLVVVRIGSGHFTGGGHYMVLGGVDPDAKKVYVYDPNNRSNKSYRKTGNGWYSFNDIIVKEAYNFYIMWKG